MTTGRTPEAPPAQPRRSHARSNRVRLLAAAREELGRDPDASLDEIARAAGVVRRTLYGHFPNREALIDALADRGPGAAGRGVHRRAAGRRGSADGAGRADPGLVGRGRPLPDADLAGPAAAGRGAAAGNPGPGPGRSERDPGPRPAGRVVRHAPARAGAGAGHRVGGAGPAGEPAASAGISTGVSTVERSHRRGRGHGGAGHGGGEPGRGRGLCPAALRTGR